VATNHIAFLQGFRYTGGIRCPIIIWVYKLPSINFHHKICRSRAEIERRIPIRVRCYPATPATAAAVSHIALSARSYVFNLQVQLFFLQTNPHRTQNMARLSSMNPPAVAADPTSANLTRMLARLQKTIINPDVETEARLHHSSLERQKLTAVRILFVDSDPEADILGVESGICKIIADKIGTRCAEYQGTSKKARNTSGFSGQENEVAGSV